MIVGYHPIFANDLSEAAGYYECRESGLGSAFIDEVEAAEGRILANPEAWSRIDGNVRHLVLHRFPYAIHYEIAAADRIFIYGLYHGARDPEYSRQRLD